MTLSYSKPALALLLWLLVLVLFPPSAVSAFHQFSARSFTSTRNVRQDVRRASTSSTIYLPLPFLLSGAKSGVNGDTSRTTTATKEDASIAPYKALLLDALGYNTTAASVLLEHIQAQENAFFLDNLLESGPDARLPFWSHFKPLARTSRRARWAALRRVLDQQVDADENVKRSNSLVSILENLAELENDDIMTKPAILVLWKEQQQLSSGTIESEEPSSSFSAEQKRMAEEKLEEELKEARMAAETKKKKSIPLPGMNVESMMNKAASPVVVVEEALGSVVKENKENTATSATTTTDIEIAAVPRQTTTQREKIGVVVPRPPRSTNKDGGGITALARRDFEIVAAPRNPSTLKASRKQDDDESSEDEDESTSDDEEEDETQRLMKQVKESGRAGIISYALWELGFWFISIPVCILGYQKVTGHWPDLTNAEDQAKLGAEAFAFVNFARFAVPLRIGLAVSTTPWIQENIVDQFLVSDDNEGDDAAGDNKKKEE